MTTPDTKTGHADVQHQFDSLPKPAIEGRKKRSRPKTRNENTEAKATPPPKEYLKLTCPSKLCDQKITLICPYCGDGALSCLSTPSLMECDTCHHSLRAIKCSCGFTLKAPYVYEKQKRLARLLTDYDVKGYKAIFVTFITLCGILWILTRF